jgi:hypothetical protein
MFKICALSVVAVCVMVISLYASADSSSAYLELRKKEVDKPILLDKEV